jgi:signal transduction histidine kinase
MTLLNEVCRVMEVPSSSVWLVDPDTGNLVCRHAVGPQSELMRGWRLSPGEGILGWVAAHGEPIIVPDARADSRHLGGVDQTTGLFVQSILSVPLGLRGKVIGVLNVVDTVANRFGPADQTLLELLATSAAIALDNAGLVETLRQRADELKARNEELDAFAHTVAHDLNNPLSNVIGYAETLEMYYDKMPDAVRRDSIQAISRSGRKMNNIIDELLLLSGVRQTEAKRMPLDMAGIVAEAQSRLADMINEAHASVTTPPPSAWLTAMGYAPWVEEVWVNYLSNAIKYGGKPPCIELGATLQRDGMIRYWIHDNGPGIPPDARARLFSPFTRLDQIRARGHGLGLSIVRRIVEKLGGQVGVESEGVPGAGSTFYFILPSITW